MSEYFGYSKGQLDSTSFNAPTVQPSVGDIIKMLSTSGALVSDEYYQITSYDPGYNGYYLIDKDGANQAPWGEPYLIFDNERDTVWSLLNLSGVVYEPMSGPSDLSLVEEVVEGVVERFTGDVETFTNLPVSSYGGTKELEMIYCEPGTFNMGQSGAATPVHEVTLTQGFFLSKYEVTQAQYEAVMTGNTEGLNPNPSNNASDIYKAPDYPVEKASWNDIQVFLARLNEQEAGNLPEYWSYALPTEAQWEYACRAGTTTNYSLGNTISTSQANYNAAIGKTTTVGSYAENPWGFYDMHGNVDEWTADAMRGYSTDPQTDPFTAGTTASERVHRGGSFNSTSNQLYSAYRSDRDPVNRFHYIGFRLALVYPKPPSTGPGAVEIEVVPPAAGPKEIEIGYAPISTGPEGVEASVILPISFGPEEVALSILPTEGPKEVEVLSLLNKGPQEVSLFKLIDNGPKEVAVSVIAPSSSGPKEVEVSKIASTGPQEVSLVKIIDNGPEKVEVKLLPYNGPDSIESVLLPYTGPIALSVIDTRALPVEELSNAPVIPDKGKSNLLNCPPENGPTGITLNPDPIGVEGYYPLYKTEELANLNSPLGTHHTHFLDFKLYYMPNGLEKVWHGDWVGPTNPEKGPTKISLHDVVRGRTKTPKYISHMYDSRASALTGPFTYSDITTITSRDNTSEVYAVDSDHNVIVSKLNDLKDTEFKYPGYRIHTHEKFNIESEKGFIGSEEGSFMYRGKFLKTPFADAVRTEGEIVDPLYFKDCYLAIAETNWMHLGSEGALKELYRVDLTFAESSLGHVWLYAMNESHKVSGQYKGEIRDNMKVFTNLRGKRFKIKLFVATHEQYPWSMREMSLGYNQGSNY